jgi:hypothetical protein
MLPINYSKEIDVKISKHTLAIAAAFAGLAGGTAARAAQPHPTGGSVLSAGLFADDNAKKQIEKHACKGLNSCKGNGGGDKSQWGKNDCKGKGACATDGSKPKA